MSDFRLDEAYRIANPSGVEAHRVVVAGENEHECALPVGGNSANVLGVTMQTQPREGRFVAVRRAGLAPVVAAGAIARNAHVAIADELGRVKEVPNPLFTLGEAVSNNALTAEWLDREHFSLAMRVVLADPGEAATFSWSFTNGDLRLSLASGEAITETANTLITAVEADAVLSRIIKFANAGGSNGSGVLAAEVSQVTNATELLNPIGTAQQSAAQAGDRINVLLIP